MSLKLSSIKNHSFGRGQLKAGAVSSFKRLGRFLYNISYKTGLAAENWAHKVREGMQAVFDIALSEVFKGLKDFARNIAEIKRSRTWRGEVSVTRGIINAGAGLIDTVSICKEAFRRGGFVNGFAVAGRFIRRGAVRFFTNKKSVLNYIAPAVSVFVLGLTIYFWSNATFALSVSYEGKELGVVASEQTYRDAADKVEMNVSDASGSDFELDGEVTYKLVLAKKSELSDEEQIYNNIVMKSCNGVKTGYGLYVDNRLAGATDESGAIEAMLNELTEEYKDDPQVQKVGFVQDVSVKAGVFPESVFKSVDEIKDTVTANDSSNSYSGTVTTLKASSGVFRVSLDPLYATSLVDDSAVEEADTVASVGSHPTLSVKVIKNEVYKKEIPYKVEKVKSSKLRYGKTKVSVKGKNGVQEVVAAVTYVDGVKTDEDIISTTTLEEPVTEKVLVGTKKDDEYSASGSGCSAAVEYARRALGVPYVSGGCSFSGFDCSGLTKYVYSKLGVYLPHSAAAQSAYGSYVSRSSLKAGDLVFFDTNGGHNNITHVGIYIGGGKFIDASSSRPHAVTIDSLNSSYYSSRYMTARRIINK